MTGLFHIFIAVLATASLGEADYCHLKTCDNQPHTMCLFASQKPSDRCISYAVASLTPAQKKGILDAHNKLRNFVAQGKETRGIGGPQPGGDIGSLKWDNELEQVAQRWANQCKFAHDLCRNVDRFHVGQNIAIKWQSHKYLEDFTELVENWYNEVENYNHRDISSHRRDKKTGHYTQMVWGKTTTIGCGAVMYRENKNGLLWYTTYLVCNYGPAGNVLERPVYQTR